jgi:membrane protein required for colicin V production
MAALDWIFVALLLASMLTGAWRGLVYEFLSLAGWVVAFVVAQWFAQDAAALLPIDEAQETVRYAAGFILVFIVTVFACGFLAWLGKKLVEAIGLRPGTGRWVPYLVCCVGY